MADGIRWIGLDVHAHESTIAIFDQATGEVITRRVVGRPHALMPWLRGVARPARMVYEAGPTGYGLARRALAEGIELAVCAPGRTDRDPTDRVKTRQARCDPLGAAAGGGRADDGRGPVGRASAAARPGSLPGGHPRGSDARAPPAGEVLLRREIYYGGPHTAWSRRHRAWLASLRFADRASQLTIADYLHSHDVLLARRAQIEAELEQLAGDSPWAVTIGRLRCLRGIDTLSALGLCAEVGAFDRFGHPDQLSAYLGIVPSENTTGQQRRQGAITKAGSTHARRLLVEAAYHYQRNPGIGQALERRQRDQPAEIINIAWRAQRRLHARWRQLKHARGKRNGIVAVAIARELAGFCWELATWEQPHPDRVPPASMPAGDPLTQAASLPPKHEVGATA